MVAANLDYACAPFEAEWQCMCLEKCHVVDAVMSTYGDYVVIGESVLWHNVNFNDETLKVYNKKIDAVYALINPLLKHDSNKW